MTQIGGFIQPTRRAGQLGVHSLDHFSFSVPDLTQAQDFYRSFGLNVNTGGSYLDLHTFGNDHCWGRLTEAREKRLSYISFGIFEDDLEGFRKNLRELSIAELSPPPGMERNSVWVRDNNCILIELKVAEKCSPNAKTVFGPPVSTAEGLRGAGFRETIAPTRPRRLAHILVFVRDIAESIKFYAAAFGLRLSDEAGGGVAFMHGIHGSDHHLVAFAKSDHPGFHHCSWDVGSIEDIGLGAMQMAERGYDKGWGFGRHVLGSNYFHYVRDPWGSYSEYSADIDYIPVSMDWEGKSHAPENSFYLWGPTPPADFAVNHEVA
jgi:catechol 2,3-dioxygenase-like lactoylglutathione lyase family enzyme